MKPIKSFLFNLLLMLLLLPLGSAGLTPAQASYNTHETNALSQTKFFAGAGYAFNQLTNKGSETYLEEKSACGGDQDCEDAATIRALVESERNLLSTVGCDSEQSCGAIGEDAREAYKALLEAEVGLGEYEKQLLQQQDKGTSKALSRSRSFESSERAPYTTAALVSLEESLDPPVSGETPPLTGEALGIYERLEKVRIAVDAVLSVRNVPKSIASVFRKGGRSGVEGGGGVKQPLWSSTKNRPSTVNAFEHYKKHKSEFPEFQNAKQYAEGAKKFLNSPPKGTLTKMNARGDTMRYDPSTNTFGVLSKDGAPRTMFRPKDGIDYWNRQ